MMQVAVMTTRTMKDVQIICTWLQSGHHCQHTDTLLYSVFYRPDNPHTAQSIASMKR